MTLKSWYNSENVKKYRRWWGIPYTIVFIFILWFVLFYTPEQIFNIDDLTKENIMNSRLKNDIQAPYYVNMEFYISQLCDATKGRLWFVMLLTFIMLGLRDITEWVKSIWENKTTENIHDCIKTLFDTCVYFALVGFLTTYAFT